MEIVNSLRFICFYGRLFSVSTHGINEYFKLDAVCKIPVVSKYI